MRDLKLYGVWRIWPNGPVSKGGKGRQETKKTRVGGEGGGAVLSPKRWAGKRNKPFRAGISSIMPHSSEGKSLYREKDYRELEKESHAALRKKYTKRGAWGTGRGTFP